jgi:hypothetical protein
LFRSIKYPIDRVNMIYNGSEEIVMIWVEWLLKTENLRWSMMAVTAVFTMVFLQFGSRLSVTVCEREGAQMVGPNFCPYTSKLLLVRLWQQMK